MPALLTRMSTPPQASTTAATPAFTWPSSVTSMASGIAPVPFAFSSSAAAVAAAMFMSAIATLAPSRA